MKTKSHTIYKLKDGSRVCGVTTILSVIAKPQLIKWANDLGLDGVDSSRYVDDKADIGTLAHDIAVNHLKGLPTDTSDYSENQIKQAKWALNSFLDWLKSHNVELLQAETAMVSEDHKYGGTDDIYAVVDGVVEVVDLKTGSAIYDEHKIQVAGGYGILREENGHKVERFRILNIPRANNEHWGEVIIYPEQTPLLRDLFLTCLRLHNLKKQLSGKAIYPKNHKEK